MNPDKLKRTKTLDCQSAQHVNATTAHLKPARTPRGPRHPAAPQNQLRPRFTCNLVTHYLFRLDQRNVSQSTSLFQPLATPTSSFRLSQRHDTTAP
ncbi:hypothetical protein H9L39_10510 [Fusarium oxysporum f. sp. albedinis]|nr:hypothetical protein H9L39_10510 [Fusarium oxysporum f. sp. albedinis]